MSDNAGLFGGILIILVSIFFMLKSNPQRIFIHDDLSISNNNIYVEHVDTVITDVSRWFYTQRNDRKMRNITISVYKEPSQGKPYEFYELSPDDYADISLRQGNNIVIIRTLGEYPFTEKRYRILKFNEKKK